MLFNKSYMASMSLLMFAAGAAATETLTLRGLQAAATPMVARSCNATELDASLDALAEDAKCGAAWTTFSDTISTAEFNLMPLAGQVKALEAFCATPCGPSFDKAVTEWRNWCDSKKATFTPMDDVDEDEDEDEDMAVTFDGFVAEFGCSKSAGGQFCAQLVMAEIAAKPDDLETKCDYYSSCCFGELNRIVKVTDLESRAPALDAKCPGARAALESKCATA